MHPRLIVQALVLLALANGTPVMINRLIGRRWSYAVDGGVKFVDGRPLFGASKTARGVLCAVLATVVGAVLMGLGWSVGALFGSVVMAGDLFSSFVKRRMRVEAGGRATGLDQIPESLFPLLACRHALGLTALDIGAIVAVFFVGEVLLSIVFFKLHLRERPY